jgi:hypothetical protein
MVKQYPHTGKVFVAESSVKDANGNWPESSGSLLVETVCRAEPNKGNQYVIGQGGKQITFSSIVYMPIPVQEIKPGMLFEVWDGELLKVREPVKQFSKGQLNARVWL